MMIMFEPPQPQEFGWRDMAAYLAGPPDVEVVVPAGLVCPLDDVVLDAGVEPGAHICPACLGRWDSGGGNGTWLPLHLDHDLESVGGLTLDEAVAFDDLAESSGLFSGEGRVTCRLCWAWATPEHLASEQHVTAATEWVDE